MVSRSSSICV
jgi:hypothetical protein